MTHAPSFLSAVRPTFPDRSSPLHLPIEVSSKSFVACNSGSALMRAPSSAPSISGICISSKPT